MNSIFNIIKNPVDELIKNKQILSPQVKKVNNKISNNKSKSISQKKEKKRNNFYLSNEIYCNYKQNKIEIFF